MNELIVRIAARGDGVTASGRHVPFGVPGDALLDDGALAPGPHHQQPPCRHFPECGGCQLQHVDDEAYRGYLISRVEMALAQHQLATDIREPHLSPPNSRRRAALRVLKLGQGVVIGFNAAKSHRIVDMQENHILCPELLALLPPLRALLDGILPPRRTAEVQITLIDQGPDVLLTGVETRGLHAIEALTSFAAAQSLARLSVDQGLGPETIYEPQPATVTLSGVPVAFPCGGFLQATMDGEGALVDAVREATSGASRIADLFAGLGTFAIATRAAYAAEASRDAATALARAAPAMRVEHRDLYRRPLDRGELNQFDAIILDPPRAGAAEQVARLATSDVQRIAYVSCNPATFARDAVREATSGASRIADLFAGLGTFAIATRAAYAAEASRDAAAALARAAPGMRVEHRDLYRRPLDRGELNQFDAIILDPPRAGAAEQVARLATSDVQRIAYVSCNPATFARDAAALVGAGYTLDWVRPVGQFRWSTHVELAASFTR